MLGASRALSVSTTSTISILTATAIGGVAGTGVDPATAATTLAVMSGAILLGAGLLKIGTLADYYISTPILTGFKIGTALVIIASQLGKLLGIDAEGQDFFVKVWSGLRADQGPGSGRRSSRPGAGDRPVRSTGHGGHSGSARR